MRYINRIIIHCTGNSATSKITIEDMRRDHMTRLHAIDIGYHYVVFPDGSVKRGRPVSQRGAHCYGYNEHSIGVAYVGGLGKDGSHQDTRTPGQKQALLQLVANLIRMYRCDVWGHRDLSRDRNGDGKITPDEWVKDCPCFDAHKEYHGLYEQIVLGVKNIQK